MDLVDGQQINVSGGSFQMNSTAYTEGYIYTVKKCFQQILLNYLMLDGTTAQNVTSFSSMPTANTWCCLVSNVQGEFSAEETIVGQTSSNTATIQADTIGYKGV